VRPVRPGDVVIVHLNPTRGTEQQSPAGGRPCVVVGGPFNWDSLVIVVPLTSTDRGWVTHVPIHTDRTSLAMCEQVRSIATDRITRIAGTVDASDLADIQSTLGRLINVY